MKIRIGFVSNSSTSSFICVLTVEAYNKLLEELHPFVRACVEQCLHCKDGTLPSDVKIKVLQYYSEMGGADGELAYVNVDYDGEVPDSVDDPGDKMSHYEAINTFEEMVEEIETIVDWHA